MKKAILLLLILTSFSTPAFSAEETPPDRWIAVDKLQHLLISAHLSLFTYKVSRESFNNLPATARVEATGLVLSIGIGKELLDRRKPKDRFSYKDLLADVLGIGLGLVIGHNLK